MVCALYYYYDVGTKKCEYCCEICCDANKKGTSIQCEEDCPKYAQKQRQEAAQQLLHDGQSVDGLGGQSKGSGQSSFPMASQIGIATASVIITLFLLLGFAFIFKSKFPTRKNALRAAQPTPPNEVVDQTETIPLQPQPSLSHDINLRIVDETNQDPLGFRESLEERTRDGSGEMIAPVELFGRVHGRVLQTASCDDQQPPGKPYQESMEGRLGNSELVTNKGNLLISGNTEPKTFATSDHFGVGITRV